jgi:hypothetical protein
MNKPSWTYARWIVLLFVSALALLLSVAQAANVVRIASAPDMVFVDAEDDEEPLEKVGLDLVYDDGLVVIVTAEGKGALGNAAIASYAVDDMPLNALEEHDLDRCAKWIGAVTEYVGGVIFEVEDVSVASLASTLQARLVDIGFEVAEGAPPGGRIFFFTRDGVTYRAVFQAEAGGTSVYLGL